MRVGDALQGLLINATQNAQIEKSRSIISGHLIGIDDTFSTPPQVPLDPSLRAVSWPLALALLVHILVLELMTVNDDD